MIRNVVVSCKMPDNFTFGCHFNYIIPLLCIVASYPSENKDMKSAWTVFTNANKRAGAEKIFSRILDNMEIEAQDVEFTPYRKGGFKVDFNIDHDIKNWNELVVECIALGQSAGNEWQLFGDIYQDPSALTTKVNISGVAMLEWQIIKQNNRK